MKRIITVAAVLLTLPLLCSAQYRAEYKALQESEVASAMHSEVGYLASAMLEGRAAGSEGEKLAAEYVSSKLEEYGIDVLSGAEGDLFGMKLESGDTLRSRNVVALIPGYDHNLRNHYIVVGARLDNIGTRTVNINGTDVQKIYYGACGNASGLSMLMELGRMLQENKVLLKRSVLLVAFGSSLEANAGSWYFLNRSFPDASNIDAMINLDMVGTGSSGMYAYTGSNYDLNTLVTRLSTTLQPIQPKLVANEPVASDHRSFYNSEIPAIMFTTGMYPEYNTDRDTPSIVEYDNMERILEYVYNFSVELANGEKPHFRKEDAPQNTAPKGVVSYADCDYRPTFLGSADPAVFLQKWVYVYLRYPRTAVEEGVQGRVLVDFVIDERGKVTDVKVAKGVDPRLDDEAVRVISASPDWKPGRVRGQKVKTALSLYVEFKLKKK